MLGPLANLIFGKPLDQIENGLAGTGIDVELVKEVVVAMQEHASALFLLVRPDSISDAREVLKVLTLFEGKIHHTTLSPQAEDLVLQALDRFSDEKEVY